MTQPRITEEQILLAVKQAAAEQPVVDACRQNGISEATFYVWQKRYCNPGLVDVRENGQQRDANARRKRLMTNLTLDQHVL
jgi:putative transposase